jgi:surface carbohydrate biosynthesis protein (TIGR04326 family)
MPENDTEILSFLTPRQDEDLKTRFSGKILSAREIAQGLKDRSRNLYVEIIARAGATPGRDGKTLRQALKGSNGVSLWWFHKVSERDCEGDSTFGSIVEVLVIASVAGAPENKEVILFGARKETADVLSSLYNVREVQSRRTHDIGYLFARGGFHRVKYFAALLAKWLTLRMTVTNPETAFHVAFSGFWDWSVKEKKDMEALTDVYFRSLPDILSSSGLKICWFLWFDPYGGTPSHHVRLRSVLEPIQRYRNLVVLQRLVRVSDMVRAALNFKPYFVFLRYCRTDAFKKAFTCEGINFWPFFRARLSYGFIDATIPHFELVCTSSARAFMKYTPRISFSFLELYLYSRAFYAGGKLGCQEALHCAVQHAGYSREKTFVLLQPEIEYEGQPDGCPVPKPDYVFAMGELGRDIFIEDGFPKERVFLTGSPRYDHVRIRDNHKRSTADSTNILVVTSLGVDLEIDLVEAVCTAAKGLSSVRLLVRSHPFARIEEHPRFRVFRHQVELTNRSLEEDLERADLVVVTYSSVGEEALLKGVPVWVWLTGSYNGSAFRDIGVVPAFYSVGDLRNALEKFIGEPASFAPEEKVKEDVLRKCFFKDDGNSAGRIARICQDLLSNVRS